ncbi:MAG: TolC family protein [Deltaproteobacteria bacterium]|nr:TolC family protein [Deltaproteobacteria bacterium]
MAGALRRCRDRGLRSRPLRAGRARAPERGPPALRAPERRARRRLRRPRRAAPSPRAPRALAASRGALVAAYRRYQAALVRARDLAADVVPAAAEAVRLAEIGYDQGEGGLVLVLEAQRAYAEARAASLDAQLGAAEARAELERAAGGPW